MGLLERHNYMPYYIIKAAKLQLFFLGQLAIVSLHKNAVLDLCIV